MILAGAFCRRPRATNGSESGVSSHGSQGLEYISRRNLEAPMSCCDETTARVPDTNVSRRSLLKGAAVVASVIPARSAQGQGKQIKLAYCSQILCGVPYEVARSAGIFKYHGLDVQLVYSRGGNAAIQALVGGAVD